MVEVIIFGDSEDILRVQVARDLQRIDGKLWPVGTKVPNPRPSEFVILRRVGGVRRDLVTDEPTILVEVWANTESRAVRIAAIIQGLLHSYSQIGEYSILGCDEISGPVNLPDGLSAQVRYTATYVVAIRSNETVSPT
ncbi:tail terminator [Arthrobacter phage Suppi]|uniref:Tail terminator n=4 Tax=Korravirus wayne TaxID=1982085 RepID=A0A1D8ESM7_9CAUD|nr:tail terminator [Arthrobacter phage Wayne]ALY10739.1 tail terminator [Arthrobacter phage Wayne]AOT24042.1 tail terminator [Arthrobacter phage Suppi]ASR83250.1 tail terminator [Arthrobacter phage Canowicakte]AZF97650.1 tail terminator [Arthrobacter phage CallieOMalley]